MAERPVRPVRLESWTCPGCEERRLAREVLVCLTCGHHGPEFQRLRKDLQDLRRWPPLAFLHLLQLLLVLTLVLR